VDIDFDPAKERLVLSASLGRPSQEAERDVCEAALRNNALWQVADAVVGRDGPGSEFVLLRHLSAAELDRPRFEASLASLIEAARGWRSMIQQTASSSTATLVPAHASFAIVAHLLRRRRE
jgi:hypothetical protein